MTCVPARGGFAPAGRFRWSRRALGAYRARMSPQVWIVVMGTGNGSARGPMFGNVLAQKTETVCQRRENPYSDANG